MEYTEIDIRLKPVMPFADILVARLNEINFESYCEDETGVKAYVQTHLLDENAVKEIINEVEKLCELSYMITKVKQENWNEKWENNSFALLGLHEPPYNIEVLKATSFPYCSTNIFLMNACISCA